MAFIVEDGTAVPDANAYVSLAAANAYWDDRGASAEWTAASDAVKQQAIVKATEYINFAFAWVSEEAVYDQALAWPRYDYDGLPSELLNATARLAGDVTGGVELAASVASTDHITSVKAGSVKVDFNEDAQSSVASLGGVVFPWLNRMLREYIDGGVGSCSLKVERT